MTTSRHLIDPDHPDDAESVAPMLAERLRAVPPAPDRAAAMRGRLLDRVRASDDAQARLVGSRLDEGEWRPLVRGVRTKILSSAHHAVLLEFEAGAQLPIHRHDEDEECVVLRGAVQVDFEGGQLLVSAGQAILTRAGEWIRYSTPGEEGAEYVAVCLPAFAPETVHRDEP